MTPEAKIKAKVKKLLAEHNAYYFMPVQTGYGAQTLDFLVCAYGLFIGIETKVPGRKPTANQQRVVEAIQGAGGIAVVEYGDLFGLADVLEDARNVKEALCKQ